MLKVAPRDIFNEANFVKCLSQILFNMSKLDETPNLRILIDDSEDGLKSMFSLNKDDGGMLADAKIFNIKNHEMFELTRPMNSREAFPLELLSFNSGENHEVFTNTGEWNLSMLDLFGDGGEHQKPEVVDYERLFSYSKFIKSIGKLALLSIDNSLPGIEFDEFEYSELGHIPFNESGGHFYHDADNVQLFHIDGEPAELRSPNTATLDNPWPLEININNRNVRVFNDDGEVNPYILKPEIRKQGNFKETPLRSVPPQIASETVNSPKGP